MTPDVLKQLETDDRFEPLDVLFARFIYETAKGDGPAALAAAFASRATRQGNICFDSEKQLEEIGDIGLFLNNISSMEKWLVHLEKSRAFAKKNRPAPLKKDDKGRIYLFRYWEYQQNLARRVRKWAGMPLPDLDWENAGRVLARLFPKTDETPVDWQMTAAFTAAVRRFCVISGGPGTGKTYTVVRIMAFLMAMGLVDPKDIVLAAPTGKAAARLQEAVNQAGAASPELFGTHAMPKTAFTLHRLLKFIPGSPYFRHNAKNPLLERLVIVDEASMVDLALMSKLVDAIDDNGRLILLGDKDQLSSVEAGSVLADICGPKKTNGFSEDFCRAYKMATGARLPVSEEKGPVADCLVYLTQSRRFDPLSGIGGVSRSINCGDGNAALDLLIQNPSGGARFRPLTGLDQYAAGLRNALKQGFGPYFQFVRGLKFANPDEIVQSLEQAFSLLDQFRVLCPIREGPQGVTTVNRTAGEMCGRVMDEPPNRPWYHGRPVMITQNDYALSLFNGDLGIALNDPLEKNGVRVWFAMGTGQFRAIHPLRLKAHETAFAMTVHKSQGSEFSRVLLLMPHVDTPVLTRELLYTAVTRAKDVVEIWGKKGILKTAIGRQTRRFSGLEDALWGD